MLRFKAAKDYFFVVFFRSVTRYTPPKITIQAKSCNQPSFSPSRTPQKIATMGSK